MMNTQEAVKTQEIPTIRAMEEFGELIAEHVSLGALVPYEPEIRNYFANGMYARELRANFGSFVVGKIHHTENFMILSEGQICLINSGEARQWYAAPAMIQRKAGVKSICFMLSDVTLTTICRTDKTDPVEAEKELVSDTEEQFLLNSAGVAKLEGK